MLFFTSQTDPEDPQYAADDEDQDSQGDLNTLNSHNDQFQATLGGLNLVAATNGQVQNSQGDLNQELLGSYQTVRESIEEIATNRIEHYTDIPDYKDDSIAEMPLIIKVGQRSICVDNWRLVEQAQAAGTEMITCAVSYKEAVSEVELALTKAAHRVAPAGGRARYAEIIRNVVYLQIMLQQSGTPIHVYSHGGARKGLNYTSNKEQNVTMILAERLGKNPDTISMYRSYGNYLTDEVLELLIDGNAQKRFFEEARANKRYLVRKLQGEGKSEEEICAAISEKLPGWFQEYTTTGTIADVFESEAPAETQPHEPTQTDNHSDRQPRGQMPTVHHHWVPEEGEAGQTVEALLEEGKHLMHAYLESAEALPLVTERRILFEHTVASLTEIRERMPALNDMLEEVEDGRAS